jgi:hypothetical protein
MKIPAAFAFAVLGSAAWPGGPGEARGEPPARLGPAARGRTLIPALVGMHDHMYCTARPDLDAGGHSDPPLVVPQMTCSSPRLHLAAGVTTVRTAGSVEGCADLNLRGLVDSWQVPGPHLDVTAPYLQGKSDLYVQGWSSTPSSCWRASGADTASTERLRPACHVPRGGAADHRVTSEVATCRDG